MKSDVLEWKDDGLMVIEVGPWSEEKYRLLFNYIQMFSTGMKKKWEKRVYVDLYSGPGCVRIRDTKKLLRGSPLLALTVKDPFDKYIFCELELPKLQALRNRVGNHYSQFDVTFIEGDCNEKVNDIVKAIPKHSSVQRVLSFCFVDPFSLDIHFETIRTLAVKFMDFLVLLALGMDANRNVGLYVKSNKSKIDKFLGLADWRKKWDRYHSENKSIQKFLADMFEQQMLSLGYLKSPRGNTKEIRSSDKNLPLYHLAFFSRDELGYEYWDEVLKYSSDQLRLPL